jgi:benzil reductase ((S)-benzoin forming)
MTIPKIAVVTGGGSGLGREIAQQLASQNIHVFIAGRRKHKLLETQAFSKKFIIPVCADISTPKGRALLKKSLKGQGIDYLVHNAAIVTPLQPLEKITLAAFRKIQSINVEGPLFLTQLLLPQLNKNARVLHISSDCAETALAHWSPYCTSKAALYMLYQCLKKEFSQRNIHIGSIDPGMMDTPMQRYICHEKNQFPEKYTLEELIKENLLLSPVFSAEICVKLLLKVSSKKFSEREWCAYEKNIEAL